MDITLCVNTYFGALKGPWFPPYHSSTCIFLKWCRLSEIIPGWKQLNSKVVRSNKPPNSRGEIYMRHDKSSLEFPQTDLIPISSSGFSTEA